MHISEIINHLGEDRENYFNAVAPPIIQTSNFAYPTIESFRHAFSDEFSHHLYTRGNNPTVQMLRKKIAALEGTEDALIVSSGAAATAMAVLANVRSGDHIICVENPYTWTKNLLTAFLQRFQVSCTFVDGRETENLKAAIRPETSIMILESPNSMTFELQDLQACALLAREHGILTMIDNSNCSPLFQCPAKSGIDLVIHTGTKYLNGHSDVVNGAICGSEEQIRKIFESGVMTLGNVISPQDAWLIIRGLRTFELRVRRSYESALKIAEWMESQSGFSKVLFPMLPSFPQYGLAKRQMSGCAGLITTYLNTDDIKIVESFVSRLNHFLLAVSWGGHESLVLPIAAFYGMQGQEDPAHPFTLIRFYIGLEDPGWLIKDIEQALLVLR